MSVAEKILNEASSDPRGALERGEAYLRMLDPGEYAERSITLRAMGLAARDRSRLEESIEFSRQAAEAAAAGGDEHLRLLGILTMTGSLSISGREAEALALIEENTAAAQDPELLARFKFQRAAVLQNLGRSAEAAKAFDLVLPDFRSLGDRSAVLLIVNRLGRINTASGRLADAERYLREAFDLAMELDDKSSLHGIEHNLGQLEFYRGDIPAALDWLQKSDEHSMAISGASAPQHVTRGEVLSSVGRYAEAQELATLIARERRSRGDIEHATNALAVAAEAALAGGDFVQAQRFASEVLELTDEADFLLQAQARRIRTEARFAAEGPSRELLDEVTAMAGELARQGQMVASGQAYLLAGRIAMAIGERETARSSLQSVTDLTTGPLETRLQSYLARALIRLEDGETRGAASAVRSGLNLLDAYQSALGASDLRAGIERQGAELGELGLRLALDSGRPRRVLEWLDRNRGRALRYQPVVPSGDDAVTGALSELRLVEAELRRNPDDLALLRRRRRLQQDIAASDRVRRGTMLASEKFSISNLIDSLSDRTLFEIGQHDGRLFAVLVRKGRARVVELGEAERAINEVGHIRFGMRRAARRGRPVDLNALERLDTMLFGGVEFGDEVIIVPPPSLMAVPWAGLPTMSEALLTISPSAEMWWRAHQVESSDGPVLIAGGPDLELAGAEVEAVGDLYPSPTVLAPGTGVEEVRSGLAGARTAHVVCHAAFQVENPMFSSLRLGDGDLNVYDIERLEKPPCLVVLSACDSGYTEARAGDELAGLTSALLSMGTRSVVASVGLVPDSDATGALMVRFHKGLIAGLSPAAALATARAGSTGDAADLIAAASFVCVGA